MAKPDLSDYNEVAERVKEFHEKYPDGSLQSECNFTEVNGGALVVVKAYAFRSMEDTRPGIGHASEPIPGKTPYTKDSELMNAETSAWGRAIIALGASTAKKIASREEVRNRTPVQSPGTTALLKAAQDSGIPLALVAQEFTKAYGVHPSGAPEDALKAFAALVQSGAVTVVASGEQG